LFLRKKIRKNSKNKNMLLCLVKEHKFVKKKKKVKRKKNKINLKNFKKPKKIPN